MADKKRFKIICQNCGSDDCEIESVLDYGNFHYAVIDCNKCGNECTDFELWPT